MLSKHEDLSPILAPTQKVGMLAHAGKPSTNEVETGGFLASQYSLRGELQVQGRTYFKKCNKYVESDHEDS